MKQILFIGAIFCFFVFILKFFPTDFSAKVSPALFVGEEAVFFCTHKNLEERLNAFSSSKIFTKIKEINFNALTKGFNIPDEDVSELQVIAEKINNIINNQVVHELFGKEISIALFPPSASSEENIETELLQNILLISRPKHHVRIVELLSKSKKSDKKVTESRYGGYTIRRFPVDLGRVISVARVKDVMLLSFSEKLLRKSIDTYDGELSQLKEYPQFKKSITSFESASSLTYINIKQLKENVFSILNDSTVSKKKQLLREIEQLQGYHSVVWGIWNKNETVQQKIVLRFDLAEVLPRFKSLLTVIPEKTLSYKKIRKDTIWYYWTNIFRPEAILELLEDKSRKNSQRNTYLIESIAKTAGTTREDLLSLIDSHFIVAVKDISGYQFVPFPPVLMAVKVNNPEKLNEILNILIEHYQLPITKKKRNGIEISYWGEIFGNTDMQPTFAIVKGYLVLASNGEQIKEFASVSEDRTSLDYNDEFKKVDIGLTLKNNTINFLDFKKVVKMSQELVSWGGTMIAILDRDAARKTKILIDNLINPVLEGLTMYSTMGIRSYLENECLIIESMTTVDKMEY